MQLTPAQAAYHALALSLEQALKALPHVNADVATLQALQAQAETLQQALEARREAERMFPVYQYRDLSGGIEWLMPYSPVCGPCNPVAPTLCFQREPGRLVAEACFTVVHEGPPGTVHGGVLAAVYDQIFANANLFNKTGGYTASLTVDFHRPTLLDSPVRFIAWIESVEGRKVRVQGQCHDAQGELLTSGRALFIQAGGVETPDFEI